MRRRTLALLGACLVGCAGPGGPSAPEPAISREPPPIEAGVAPPAGPYAPGFDVLHYDLALSLPDTGRAIRGRARLRVARVAPVRDTLVLDLSGLAADTVRVGGDDVAFEHRAGKLRIPLPGGAGAGDTLSVEVAYHGQPDDGLILGRTAHGVGAAFADNWPDRARFWFPSIDHPSDKATVAFTVEAPAEWQVVANGVEIGGPDGSARGARRTWRWATEVPIPTYTMVVGATRFAIGSVEVPGCAAGERGGACVPVSFWVYPPDSARGAQAFARAGEMMRFYSDLIAPFPYEKLAHVQSATRFGGMENASAIFYPERGVSAGAELESTVAHETAHQWFGDAVTPAEWHELWLSEGFATYFGALFFEHADGPAAFRRILAAERAHYLASPVVGRPVIDTAERSLFALLNANSYQKGGLVLHMLRTLLGDEAFFEGVRRYYARHVHGTATTEALQRVFEEVSGRELGWFFEQWLRRPGYPVLRHTWRWDAASSEAEITIEQLQPAAWPTFRLPLVVEIALPSGVERRVIEVDDRREAVRVRLAARPAAVRIDPDGDVLAVIRTE